MPTVTIKLSAADPARLPAAAARRRASPSAALRAAFARTAAEPRTGSRWEKFGHLAGAIDGPGKRAILSQTLPGYGRSRQR